MNPIWILFAAVAVLDIVGVPLAYLVPQTSRPMLFVYARYASDDLILRAYFATLYGCFMLLFLLWMTGVFRQMRRYQRRPFDVPPPHIAKRWWWWTFLISATCVAIMFVQAGYQFPILTAATADFTYYGDASLLRTHFASRVNETLFNINLLFIATLNGAVAFFCMPGKTFRYRVVSIVLFLASASFSLAKSQIAAALFVVVLFVALGREVRVRTLVIAALVILMCIVPFYFLFAYSSDVGVVAGLLRDRVIYGQWAGLPYYFMLFDEKPVPMQALLPPYIQRLIGPPVDSPGRRVMLFMEPAAALEGIAGNVPSFYVGEAFSIWGMPGVFIAPFVVAFELWLLLGCFRLLPKNPFTVLLFAWLLYKYEIGVLDGFSVFMISGFTIVLGVLVVFVTLREGARARRAPAVAGA